MMTLRENCVPQHGRALRQQFPIFSDAPRPLHYLDSAASAQVPESVIDAVSGFDKENRANVHRGVHRLSEAATAAYEAARVDVAGVLGAAPEDIVFTPGCTAALNIAAHGLGRSLEAGDEILVGLAEHHSNLVPWQQAAALAGASVRPIPVDREGRLATERLAHLISNRTRIIAVTHVSNVTGAVTDLAAVVEAASSVGATVVVDGAQRVPHGPIDLPALGVDFYAVSGHKMFGPTGIGVLWGRREKLAALPPFMTGGGMIRQVSFEGTSFAEPPARFEAGTPPIAQAVGLGAAARWMGGLDWPAIEGHIRSLTEQALNLLAGEPGLSLIGPEGLQQRLGVISFVLDHVHTHDVAQTLDEVGVAVRAGHHCAQPLMDHYDIAGCTRLSLAPYNDTDDLDALAEGLALVRRRFGAAA